MRKAPAAVQKPRPALRMRSYKISPLPPEEEAYYAQIRELLGKLPEGVDPLTLVLRAHLIVEQLVIQSSLSLVSNPDVLVKATRLNFSTRLLILRSLMRPLIDPKSDAAFWRSLELLNGLRNDLAHKIDSPALQADITALIEAVDGWLYISHQGKFKTMTQVEQLRNALHSLCKGLCGVVAVMRDERNARRKAEAQKLTKQSASL